MSLMSLTRKLVPGDVAVQVDEARHEPALAAVDAPRSPRGSRPRARGPTASILPSLTSTTRVVDDAAARPRRQVSDLARRGSRGPGARRLAGSRQRLARRERCASGAARAARTERERAARATRAMQRDGSAHLLAVRPRRAGRSSTRRAAARRAAARRRRGPARAGRRDRRSRASSPRRRSTRAGAAAGLMPCDTA